MRGQILNPDEIAKRIEETHARFLNRLQGVKHQQEKILEHAHEVKKEKALHHLKKRIHGRD